MKAQKILILGANGKTGRRVVEKLQQQGYNNIRLGSRQANPSFDWEYPATWEAAIADAECIYITFQPDLAVPGATETMEKFTALASRKGVKKMVLLSGRGEQEAQLCEQIVMRNAASWTIVRASWFNQNFSESFFLEPVLAGYVALPRAEALEPFTDAEDIADVVVQTLLDDKHNGQVYDLTGPELLTFPQAVAEIARATKREITFQPMSLPTYIEMLRTHQVPEDHLWLIDYLFDQVLDGRNASVTHDIEKVLGRKAKSFATYVKETAATGIWNPAQ